MLVVPVLKRKVPLKKKSGQASSSHPSDSTTTPRDHSTSSMEPQPLSYEHPHPVSSPVDTTTPVIELIASPNLNLVKEDQFKRPFTEESGGHNKRLRVEETTDAARFSISSLNKGLIELVPLVDQALLSANQSIPLIEQGYCILRNKINDLTHRRQELRELLKDEKLKVKALAAENGALEEEKKTLEATLKKKKRLTDLAALRTRQMEHHEQVVADFMRSPLFLKEFALEKAGKQIVEDEFEELDVEAIWDAMPKAMFESICQRPLSNMAESTSGSSQQIEQQPHPTLELTPSDLHVNSEQTSQISMRLLLVHFVILFFKLEEAKQSIKLATGRDVKVFSVDARDYDAVKRAVEDAGPIDVLVCNHGVYIPQEVEHQDMEEIKFMIDVNLTGTFHLIKAALPRMKQTRAERGPGSIAIMSSQAGQVGIYGYAAYSASKFGLRGLAEALQHEVITDNIHVSLIFPPDTDTPGFAEEYKRRPQLTSIIAASSAAQKADDVAQKALDGIQSASFNVNCNLLGIMLSGATAGLSPQRSYLMAFLEVMTAGLMRVVALFLQWSWFAEIEKFHAKK
ncbi:NAD(P)-binding Rossmann-fold superfamily protein [Striga asiatica]|uniref:NAD(P)-binding Rossmann-fold superfamily protein n=1 Tax=Striga asiatica TaxID=4170 RepID=A0A5A7QLF3_STRAF|nr:NAD(P)-binding Rossmann-fold superfamily protein [Striga asiatica]